MAAGGSGYQPGQFPGGIPQSPYNNMGNYYQAPPQYDWSQQNAAGNYNDPYSVYQAAIPAMKQNMTNNIGDAMAQAGFGGNRYSSSAMNAAGQIGQQGANDMNSMLTSLMFAQTNRDLDRQMQAAQTTLSATPMAEDASARRYQAQEHALAQQAAQRRAQNAARLGMQRMRYQDFQSNRYGTLPLLMQALRDNTGDTPQPIITGKGGSAGWGDTLAKLAEAYYSGNRGG